MLVIPEATGSAGQSTTWATTTGGAAPVDEARKSNQSVPDTLDMGWQPRANPATRPATSLTSLSVLSLIGMPLFHPALHSPHSLSRSPPHTHTHSPPMALP